jgi:hypothetical protein
MPAIRQQQFTDMPELVDNQVSENVTKNVVGNAQKKILQSASQDEQRIQQITNTYRARNTQLGNNIIKEAYDKFPDDPSAFNEAINIGFQEQIKAMKDDDDKLEFMANMEIAKSPYNSRVNINFDEKMERIAKNTWKDFSRESVVRFSENASMLYTQTEGWQDLLIPLKEAYDSVDALDKHGNPIMSAGEKARVKDAWENKGFYGVIGWAGETYQRGNFKELKKTRDYALKNKNKFKEENGLTEDTYVKTLDALNRYVSGQPKGYGTAKGIQALVDLRARYRDADIDSDGNVNNPEYKGVDKIYDLITDYTSAYEQGLISRSNYESDIIKLKQSSYNLVREEVGVLDKTPGMGFWKSVGNILSPGRPFAEPDKTVEENMIGYIDGLVNPEGDKMTPEKTWMASDLYQRAYMALEANGISPKAVSGGIVGEQQDRIKEIAIGYAREAYPASVQFTDEQLMQPGVISMLAGVRVRENRVNEINNLYSSQFRDGVEKTLKPGSELLKNLDSQFGSTSGYKKLTEFGN